MNFLKVSFIEVQRDPYTLYQKCYSQIVKHDSIITEVVKNSRLNLLTVIGLTHFSMKTYILHTAGGV